MLLGILSDTHGYVHPELHTYLKDVDYILHAGDIGDIDVLDELETIAPVRAVWGNIDGHDIRIRTPEVQRLTIDGIRIHMRHIGGRPERWASGVAMNLQQEKPDIFICGHSHILRIERVTSMGGMLYLNPGAAGRQGFHRVKTLVRLYTEGGTATRADVVHLDDPTGKILT